MFWKIWRVVAVIIFVAFFAVCFRDNCAFIYHTDTTASFTVWSELVLLFTSLFMSLVDVFFGG